MTIRRAAITLTHSGMSARALICEAVAQVFNYGIVITLIKERAQGVPHG